MSLVNYDSTLIGWNNNPNTPSGRALGANGLEYCAGETARDNLINSMGWTISGDSKNCPVVFPFATTWMTTSANETITIPTTGGGYDYTIGWGDGTVENLMTANPSHQYAVANTYTVEITGDFPRIFINNNGSHKLKIVSIESWGNIEWASMENAFNGCTNLVYNATDAPILTNVTSCFRMFFNCTSLNGNLNNWDVSTVTNMNAMFFNASSFNLPLNNWDVSNVTDYGPYV